MMFDIIRDLFCFLFALRNSWINQFAASQFHVHYARFADVIISEI